MKLPLLLAVGVCISVTPIWAQEQPKSGSSNPPPVRSVADIEWETIKAYTHPRSVPVPADEQARETERQRQVAELVAQADRIKAFYGENPTHARIKDAKFLEARTLFLAAEAGDASQEARRSELVTALQRDPEVPVGLRAEISAWAGNWEIRRQRNLKPEERLEAHEKVARSLAVEFHDVPEVYHSLLQLARARDDENGRKLAQDLLAMPAPAAIKAQARLLVDRHALEGKRLVSIVSPAVGADSAVARIGAGAVVIYSWASWSKGSQALALRLKESAPPGAALIGVCLDTDLAAARSAAQTAGLPGEQVYDVRGREGALAQQLRLSEPALIYTTDATGVISSVSGARSFAKVPAPTSGN